MTEIKWDYQIYRETTLHVILTTIISPLEAMMAPGGTPILPNLYH